MRPVRIVALLALLCVSFPSTAQEPLPKHAIVQIGSTLWRVSESYDFAITPDSKQIAVPFSPREIRFWDAVTGATKSTLTGPVLPSHLSFSGDGKQLLLRADLGKLQMWDPATSKEGKEYLREDAIISLAQVSPDGKWLAAASGASGKYRDVTVWGTGSGRAFFTAPADPKSITGLAIAPDGSTLATVGTEGTLRLWDPATGDETLKLSAPKETGFTSHLAYSADGKSLVSTTGIEVRVWNLAKKTAEGQFSLPAIPAALSADGQRIAVVQKGAVELWDTKEQKQVKKFGEEVTSYGRVRFAPDGSFLAMLTPSGVLRVWDLGTGEERSGAAGHTATVQSLQLLSDGKTLLSASDDNSARLWDATTGKQLRRFGGANSGLQRAALSPDGKLVAAGGAYGAILIFDATSGKELNSLKDPGRSFTFSPDGKTLASLTTRRNDETVHLWDVASGKETVQFTSVATRPTVLLCSPDGQRLAVGGLSGTAPSTTLLDATSGKAQGTVEGQPVAFSPDGKHLLTVDRDGAQIWTTADRKREKSLPIKGLQVQAGAWSADSKVVALGQGTTITLLDAATGKELGRLTGHTNDIEVLTFSLDGKRLVSGSKDTTILVWDVASVGK